ncbi:MAG TPA: ribbon-helix-helix protein, CopG family [Thermoanaerobaculia bacterium]|nr:ribbon-helix-helix protein, CopG family [Thermoanaerobaculia bacterium]
MATDTSYNVTLGPELNEELSQLAANLNISKDEALRRALELFKHAAVAQSVELTNPDGDKLTVRVK